MVHPNEQHVTNETAHAPSRPSPTSSASRSLDISPERVTAELPVREELNNRHGIMHGGAIMALADNLGGTATIANLKPGQSTTTIESKTNFFAGIPIGDTAHAECTPLHRGRTTMVWQTRITRGDGRLRAGDADPDGAGAQE